MFRPTCVLGGFVLLAASVIPVAEAAMRIVSEGKSATLLRTDEFVIHSEAIGRDFVVEVTQAENLPPGEKAAVVYALDGGYGVVGTTVRLLTSGNRMTPAFVVSIGYPNVNSRHFGPRETDLVHEKVQVGPRTIGGGGAAFEAFLMEDVRPFVESRYAIDPARSVLVGHSAGALFAAHMLVHRTDAFSAYIIGSIPANGPTATLVEDAKAVATKGSGRRIFLGFAPDDVTRLGSDQFGAVLIGKASTFAARQERFEGESHVSAYLPLVTRGLPYVLPTPYALRTSIKLRPRVLDRYAGTYQSARGAITVSRAQDGLLVRPQSGGGAILKPESETTFFSSTIGGEVTFAIDADGKVMGLTMRDNGVETKATRER